MAAAQEFGDDDSSQLFKLAMRKDWEKIAQIYDSPLSHDDRLTNSADTALHIAISSYQPGREASYDVHHVLHMIACISKRSPNQDEIFSIQNEQGNTPLHLAAKVGWVPVCESILSSSRQCWKLMIIRNSDGETPIFAAAHHGGMEAFLLLHHSYSSSMQEPDESHGMTSVGGDPRQTNGQESIESLCRRSKDGNTILHTAISEAHFELAYNIIVRHEKLVDSININGELPLHVLAKKPSVFRSSIYLRLYDSIIYYCFFVAQLKKQEYKSKVDKQNRKLGTFTFKSGVHLPENYRTCGDIFQRLWKLITVIFSGFIPRKAVQFCALPVWIDRAGEEERSERHPFFPVNYTTGLMLFKFAMLIILTILGVGYGKIKTIQVKKERYIHALQIMKEMIKSVSSYKYANNGKQPLQNLASQRITPPSLPPVSDELFSHSSNEAQNIKDKKEEHFIPVPLTAPARIDNTKEKSVKTLQKEIMKADEVESAYHASAMNRTPLLVAAQMGVIEIVEEILENFPIAIQDQDASGKNVLLLAAEHRQTAVFDYLLKLNLPEYMFHHVDHEGNSILHLAAKSVPYHPWRIPGAALQMQWEIKWYKHMKHIVTHKYSAHNNKYNQTPRQIFSETHKDLLKEGTEWLIQTAESCSFIAALIATVAFATSATVPGGVNEENGIPVLRGQVAFDIFSVSSLIALCLSVTALVFFLAIITSRCQERDFKSNLPGKLLMGLTALFISIAAMLVSFCAGHTFILRDKMRIAAVPIYTVACVPVTLFAIAQLPLYFDLLWAGFAKVPLRSYKVFYQ